MQLCCKLGAPLLRRKQLLPMNKGGRRPHESSIPTRWLDLLQQVLGALHCTLKVVLLGSWILLTTQPCCLDAMAHMGGLFLIPATHQETFVQGGVPAHGADD